MTRNQIRGVMTAVAIVVAAGLGSVSGQTQQPVRGDDVLPALLEEVKGLRAAMEQMAAAGPRAQLFVSRLQLQEGRIAGMVRRLDTVRDNLVAARREYEQIRGSLKMLESDKSAGEPSNDAEGLLAGLKAHVAAAQANVTRLTAEEAQLTNDLTVEQGRWIELNQRLDELERTLVKR